ncbi:tetratricopeptide repeat protein [Kitasatospora sp. NPDC056184]|uniref:tetratricopeptide repeat protein n=1 Tax=Kitasatospora sp. NPDC056184 TaxID=3345738 RepID=UPI0035D73E15
MTRELPWKKPRTGKPITSREVAASGEGAVGAGGDIAHSALGEQSRVEHTELRADSGGSRGRIHQAGRDLHYHEHHHAPTPSPAQSAPAALAPPPAVPAGFTGRTEEMDGLLDLLHPAAGSDDASADPVVVASVLGMGGMGKTTLALAVAREAIGRGLFTGVLFLDLHGYDDTTLDADQALDAALRALGTDPERIPPGADQRAALYRIQLAARAQIGERVLVLADNANAFEQVQHLVPGAGPHRLLVTSRDDFTAALGARLVDLDVLDPEQSVALMATALRRTLPKDRRIADEPDGAARVAKLCGHLPLALQIAAAQLVAERGLKLSRLADDMQDLGERLDVLEDGPRAVRTVLERSYQRLSLPHAELFRLLAVNPGPDLATETAAAVTSVSKLKDVRARLVALSRASLIRQDPDTERWHMHDLVRAYAGEQAARHPVHAAAALQRLLDHYAFTTHEAEARMNPVEHKIGVGKQFNGRAEALAWLDVERANLVASVHAAYTAGHHEAARHLTSHLGSYLNLRRRLEDHLDIARIALDAARDSHTPAGEATAWNELGIALRALRRFDEAEAAHRTALTQHQRLGNHHNQAVAWNNLGSTLWALRRFDEAEAAHRTALTQYQELGDHNREAIAWNEIGRTLQALRRFDEAEAAHRTALTQHQKLGDRHGEAIAWSSLGRTLRDLRRFDEAEAAHRTALTQYQELGDHHNEAIAWNNLGSTLWALRRFDEAEAAHRTALTQYQELGDHNREAIAWSSLGRTLRDLRRFDEAEAAHRTALTQYQELGDHHGEAVALSGLGGTLRDLRRFDEAEAAHRAALVQFQELGDHYDEAIAWNNLGTALRIRGKMVEAIDAGERAIGLFESLDDGRRLGEASDELADTLLAAHRPAAEVRAMREVSAAAYRACGAVEEAEEALSKADE